MTLALVEAAKNIKTAAADKNPNPNQNQNPNLNQNQNPNLNQNPNPNQIMIVELNQKGDNDVRTGSNQIRAI
ncbi:MAG: hypothetical protein JJE49_03455 [Peptostreptococcaceae bacterium]|nr:hypothetical protein [Peptostreptococcaceae bacterium]